MAVRRTKAPENPDPPVDDSGGDPGGSGDDQPSGGEDAHIAQVVRDVLVELGLVGANGGDAAGAGEDDKGSGEGDKPAGRGRLIDEERGIEERVRAELRKLKAADDVDELREQVKHLAEKPPRNWRRSTRVMGWVGPDDD